VHILDKSSNANTGNIVEGISKMVLFLDTSKWVGLVVNDVGDAKARIEDNVAWSKRV